MKKTKFLKRTLTATLAATLLLSPIAEPMQGVFFKNEHVVKAATKDSDFVIKDGVLLKYNGNGGDVVIPEGVKKISDNVFYEAYYDEEEEYFLDRARIKSITFPKSLKSIGDYAFTGCIKLKKIVLPDSVTKIGKGAFSECKNLHSVTLPKNLTVIEDGVFSHCYSLNNVKLPKKITKIGSAAFFDCYSLTNINLPKSVTSINSEAFAYCYNLSEITIPSSVTHIGDCAFKRTSWLDKQTEKTPLFIIKNYLIDGSKCSKDVIIPEEVTEICSEAFIDNTKITSVTMSENVTRIGYNAFRYCTNLTDIQLSESLNYIGGSAFSGTAWAREQLENNPMLIINNVLLESNLKGDIILPDNVTSIADEAFYLSDITSVTIPESVTSIGNRSFQSCSDLTNVTISGSSITSIGDEAFQYCRKLTNINIPDSVKTIGDEAFRECKRLEEITLPDGVETIGDYAFAYCKKLKRVTIPKSVTTIGSYLFGFTSNKNITIFGEKDSKIQSYAKKNGYSFVLIGTPEKATIASAKRKNSTSFCVTCKAQSDATGYQIKYSQYRSFKNSKTLFTTTTTKTISKLKKNKTYYVKIRAYKLDANKKKAYGNWSTVKKVKLKK